MNDPISNHPVQGEVVVLDVLSIGKVLNGGESPFLGPHLHPEVELHLMTEARSFPNAKCVEVVFRVSEIGQASEDLLIAAVHDYGNRIHRDASKEIAEVLKNGRFSLVIGAIAVTALKAAAEVLLLLGDYATLKGLSESLVIFYWVILWKPAELLLYDHFPVRRRAKIGKLFANARVRVEQSKSPAK